MSKVDVILQKIENTLNNLSGVCSNKMIAQMILIDIESEATILPVNKKILSKNNALTFDELMKRDE